MLYIVENGSAADFHTNLFSNSAASRLLENLGEPPQIGELLYSD